MCVNDKEKKKHGGSIACDYDPDLHPFLLNHCILSLVLFKLLINLCFLILFRVVESSVLWSQFMSIYFGFTPFRSDMIKT